MGSAKAICSLKGKIDYDGLGWNMVGTITVGLMLVEWSSNVDDDDEYVCEDYMMIKTRMKMKMVMMMKVARSCHC